MPHFGQPTGATLPWLQMSVSPNIQVEMNWVSGLRKLPKRFFVGALRFVFFFFSWIKELSPRIITQDSSTFYHE